MSKLGLVLGMAAIMAGTSVYGGQGISMKQKDPEPAWKRKKCKSCKYFKKFSVSICEGGKHTSPTKKACSEWKQK